MTLPAFFLRSRYVILGEPINLHLFELRYRHMTAKLVEGRSSKELDGKHALSWPSPKFLFVPVPGYGFDEAYVSLIKKCRMNRDGTADVLIVPIMAKRMVARVPIPNGHGLLNVTVKSYH